jgi:hypothetical protein
MECASERSKKEPWQRRKLPSPLYAEKAARPGGLSCFGTQF